MHTKQSLKYDLNGMRIKSKDVLFVHSSMKSIGNVENGADTVLDALSESLADGLLILPAHTWEYINASNPVFDVRKSRTCVGILTELFRSRSGVIRSLHPTHSLSALGCGAKEYVKDEELKDTPCAPDSCYGKLYGLNAKILMIGVDFSKNTTVHCIEEVANVPGRLSIEKEQLYSVDYDGVVHSVPSFRHKNANSCNYRKLEPVMLAKGAMKEVKFGNAKCLLFSVKDLFDITLELLAKNILLFEDEKAVPEDWYL